MFLNEWFFLFLSELIVNRILIVSIVVNKISLLLLLLYIIYYYIYFYYYQHTNSHGIQK